jgi:hypothetical protein
MQRVSMDTREEPACAPCANLPFTLVSIQRDKRSGGLTEQS